MNKGLKAYLKLGKQGSKKIIKERKINRFKFYFMAFASFLGCLFVFPAPIFKQANISLIKQVSEKNTFEISRVFGDSDNPKRYWTTLMCLGIRTALFLSGVILLALLTFALYYVGSLIGSLTNLGILSILLTLPAAIGLIVFVWGFIIEFTPLYYYLNKYDDITISKAFNSSMRTMKEQGKKTLFMLDLIKWFKVILFVAVGYVLVSTLFNQQTTSIKIIGWIVLIVFAVAFVLMYPRISLSNKISKYYLMNDIMLEPDVVENPSLLKEKMIRQGLSKDEFLNNLFDKKLPEEDEKEDASEVAETKEEGK